MLVIQLYMSVQKRIISFKGRVEALEMENYFIIHRLAPRDKPYLLFAEEELRTIYRTFGHLSIRSRELLLRRGSGGTLETEAKSEMWYIAKSCSHCQAHAQSPQRLKHMVSSNVLRFNHIVQEDTMFMIGKHFMYMIDRATHFCAVCLLKSQSAREIWTSIQVLGKLVYVGPP